MLGYWWSYRWSGWSEMERTGSYGSTSEYSVVQWEWDKWDNVGT